MSLVASVLVIFIFYLSIGVKARPFLSTLVVLLFAAVQDLTAKGEAPVPLVNVS